MLKAKLVVVGGDAKTAEVKLRLPTVIGRGKDGVTLTLPHKLVSRQHTEIFEQKGYLFVRDLGSLNGTYVNNERIAEPVMLKPNELLTLGNVTFRAVYEVPNSNNSSVVASSQPKLAAVEKEPANEIQFDEVSKEADQSDTQDSAESVETPVKVAIVDSTDEPQEGSSSDDVLDEAVSQDGGSKTDKSLIELAQNPDEADDSRIDSSIFAIDDEEVATAGKSISLSSLDSLPDGPAQVSFVGNMNFEGESPAKEVEGIELDLGENAKPSEASEAELGSFLKKLPK